MVSFNNGAPRKTPRQKISLGAPSRHIPYGDQISKEESEGEKRMPPITRQDWRRPEQKKYNPKCVVVCTQCGQEVRATDPQIKDITIKPSEERGRGYAKEPYYPSVFNRIGREETFPIRPDNRASSSSSGDKLRMIRPKMPLDNQWARAEHPKFPRKFEFYTRTQRRRYQRMLKAQAMEKLEDKEEERSRSQKFKQPQLSRPEQVNLAMEEEEFKRAMEVIQKYKGKMSQDSSSMDVDEDPSPRRERRPKERDLGLESREKSPQVTILRRPELVIKESPCQKIAKEESKSSLNPNAMEFRPSTASKSCNMVFILPEEAVFKGQDINDNSMQDVEEWGTTAEILRESRRPKEEVSSVIILKEKAEEESTLRSSSAVFEKPTTKMANHIKPLYLSGCLDGIPVNRILVDNGAAANLIPKGMMGKLGKTEHDLITSSATLTDFTGRVSQCHGILILNLTIGTKTLVTPFFVINSKSSYNVLLGRDWIHACLAIPSTLHQCVMFWNEENIEVVWADRRPFMASTNCAEALLYDPAMGPMRVAGLDKYGRHKVIPLSPKATSVELKALYDELVGPANVRPVIQLMNSDDECDTI